MLFEWFMRPLRRSAYKRRRGLLEAEFHKNTQNTYQRVMTGLALLTEPLEYGSDRCLPLGLMGSLELRCKSIDQAYLRLHFLLREYNRVLNTTARNPTWSPFPNDNDPKHDKPGVKWLDEYYGTSDSEVARGKLRSIYLLMDNHQLSFTDQTNPERDVLFNLSRHLVRELETIVEHYL